MKRQCLLLLFSIFVAAASGISAQGRTITSLNDGWRFFKSDAANAQAPVFNDSAWQKVNVPHTWNVEDPWDDEPGYYRGPGWYRRELSITKSLADKRLFLYFEGANQVADVYVNGQKAGSHTGGYSAFSFDISELVKPDQRNVIAVRVDNSFNENIPPLTADFNFYGGIYRDVWLIAASDVHFDIIDHASSGIRIVTPHIEAGEGTVSVSGSIVNAGTAARNVEILSTVLDASKRTVAEASTKLEITPGKTQTFAYLTAPLKRPKLWSPDSPYLYSVKNLIRENGKIVDEVVEPLGFRWFSFDGEKGFFLNGKHLKLRGTNRHQDFLGLGNALPDRLHVQDMQIIKNAGLNFVRLAHYPQDPSVLEACDRLGLLVWEETPLVNYITDSPQFTANAETMVREMVRQHRNHPSVLMWGYMNEIFLRVPRGRDDLYQKTVELAQRLNRTVKEEDPTRPTTIAFHGNDIYNTTGVGEIPDVIGWNLYQGWYSATFDDFGKFIDDQHRRFPKRPLIISEYGANADRRLHSTEPRRFDSTIEYQRRFHESYLSQIDARPFIAGTAIWNQFDFGAEQRGETIPHLNQKGMYFYDRKPKDVHFLYKANLSKLPVLHIATRDWAVRSGTSAKTFPIDVYSNADNIDLSINGRSLGSKNVNEIKKASWDVPLQPGMNRLVARGTRNGKAIVDTTEIEYRIVSANSSVIAINVGSNSDFTDETGTIWLADQPYKKGEWGFIGEKAKFSYSSPPDPNVQGTNSDPLFQAFQEGLTAYRFDVPAGRYEVELLFADIKTQQPNKRVFSVSINGQARIESLDLASAPGPNQALSRKINIDAKDGIQIDFRPIKGNPIISGIKIKRL